MTSAYPCFPAGIITKDSPHTFEATVSKLTALVRGRGMKDFAVIDQSAEARSAGLDLRPTTLVLFGNPAAGTPVMEAAPLSTCPSRCSYEPVEIEPTCPTSLLKPSPFVTPSKMTSLPTLPGSSC